MERILICVRNQFFAIFILNDGGIIDSILFGPLTVLIFLCLFYNKEDDFKKIKFDRKKENS